MDVEHLERLRSRDGIAVTQVVKTHSKSMLRAAFGLGFRDSQADELVQRTWETFFEVVPGFEGRSSLKTFLWGILYNKARELRREDSRIEPHADIDEIMDQRFKEDGSWARPPAGPEGAALQAEVMAHLAQCLEDLNVSQRMVFSMQELEGASYGEICKVLSLTTTNVGVLAHRARNRLRECIERRSEGGCDA